MNNDYRIEYFKPEDRPALQKFFKEVWSPPPLIKSQNWFDWMFHRNPNVTEGEPIPLLLAHSRSGIVGMIALIPVDVWISGKPLRITWGPHLYVAPEHRRYKIALNLINKEVNDYNIAFGSGQSEETRRMQEKYGWKLIRNVSQHEKLFWNKNFLMHSFSEGLGKTAKRFAGMLYAFSYEKVSPVDRHLKVSHDGIFDEQVEALWRKCREQYSYICTRDFANLNWRFIEHPYFSYTISQAYGPDGGYRGFLVSRVEDDTCWIIDMLTDYDDVAARLALLRAVEHRANENGVVKVVCRSVCVPLEQSLRKSGYLQTYFHQHFYIKQSVNIPIPPGQYWYITTADSDMDR